MLQANNLIHASAARTATGATTATSVPSGFNSITMFVNVTAVSGTPTLDLYLQGSYDGGTTWTDLASSIQLTATGSSVLTVNQNGQASAPFASTDGTLAAASTKTVTLPALARLKYKIGGGSPSVTFTATQTLRA